jgi:5-methylcytosine-specific restriction enzyme A
MSVDLTGLRTGLRIWFADLDERRGPIVELRPHGLRGYRAILGFGTFAGEVVRQMQVAGDEDVRLARALVDSITPDVELDLSGQERGNWRILSGGFPRSSRANRTCPLSQVHLRLQASSRAVRTQRRPTADRRPRFLLEIRPAVRGCIR